MQSKSRIYMLLLIIVIPILSIATDHELYFELMAFAVAFFSIRSIIHLFRKEAPQDAESAEEKEEMTEELEEMAGIDVKRFGVGMAVAAHLLAILFLLYCAAFFHSAVLMVGVAAAIVLQLRPLIGKTGKRAEAYSKEPHRLQVIVSGILNLAVITAAVLSKLQILP